MFSWTNEAPAWRKRGCAAVFLALALVPTVSRAQFFCRAPSPPLTFARPTKPRPPTKPICAVTQSCERYEVDLYNDELSRYRRDYAAYVQDAQDYIDQLKQYVKDANDYAICEAKAVAAGD